MDFIDRLKGAAARATSAAQRALGNREEEPEALRGADTGFLDKLKDAAASASSAAQRALGNREEELEDPGGADIGFLDKLKDGASQATSASIFRRIAEVVCLASLPGCGSILV